MSQSNHSHPPLQPAPAGALALALLLTLAVLPPTLPPCTAETPLAPDDEQISFQFADPNLTAELVAAEPNVLSPVAIAWDAHRRLFVVEMRDYPLSRDGGTLRQLQDLDGDGFYEHATVFANALSFPTSVLPWNQGVLVLAPPDLLFLRDHDGDGRADERRVVFTGFGTGNQQLRANGLTWGLDGWVYGANGRSDGAVKSPADSQSTSLRGRDFRFRPDTGAFETLAGRSQFGLGLDRWGNRFLSWNTIPLRHEVFPDRYLARNPLLPVNEPILDTLPAADTGQVFPLTQPPRVFNNESASHFNALAGLTLYLGQALGPHYQDNAFIGESLRNLVHRRRLTADGPSFLAQRAELQSEFLRSRDPWFHPVNFATGPDDALYVVDFYRQFVEHPDWVPAEMRDRVDWTTGHQHGRIWRIVRKDQPRRTKPPTRAPTGSSAATLVKQLAGSNHWQRLSAHRLLLEKQDPRAIRPLAKLVRTDPAPDTRTIALHALANQHSLPPELLLHSLSDPHPRVREQAALLAETFLTSNPSAPPQRPAQTAARINDRLATLTRDPDPRVRLRAALSLGFAPDSLLRESTLVALAQQEQNPWIRLAALTGTSSLSKEQLHALLPSPTKTLRPLPIAPSPEPDRASVVERYRPALQLTGKPEAGAALFAKLCLACHYLQGHGQRVGPDLSGIATRPSDALLIDILDPSRQVAPEYATFEVTLTNGETMSGSIASESATRLTLRRAGTPDENLARTAIANIRSLGKSLMPDGLEASLTPSALADLLAFLRNPNAALLPTPPTDVPAPAPPR